MKLLVGKYGAELDRRATGRFFRPHDLKHVKEKAAIEGNQSDYKGNAYYGEYPLAFAACIGKLLYVSEAEKEEVYSLHVSTINMTW